MSNPNRKECSYSEKPNSSEVIYRQDALEALRTCYETERIDYTNGNEYINYDQAVHEVEQAPSAQPERTEYIPETKAVRSKRDCVDLSERVSATFYDQEHEEWTQQTVTIADVLDSVCDEYTILPSAQPEIIYCKDCKYYRWEIDMCDEPYSTAHNVVHECDYCSRAERKTDEQNN